MKPATMMPSKIFMKPPLLHGLRVPPGRPRQRLGSHHEIKFSAGFDLRVANHGRIDPVHRRRRSRVGGADAGHRAGAREGRIGPAQKIADATIATTAHIVYASPVIIAAIKMSRPPDRTRIRRVTKR